MTNDVLLTLVHSPLVGPSTWQPVADALDRMGRAVAVPVLRDDGSPPYWRQHAESVAAALTADDHPVILVAHSGAGGLVSVIADALGAPVAGYVLVDAGMPPQGRTRLQQFEDEGAGFADALGALLDAGGRFPQWTEDDLAPLVPDPDRRRRLIADLRPRGRDFFTEPIPAVGRWPDAPGAYLRWTETYDVHAGTAEELGWTVVRHDVGHFHMLADPEGVAATIDDLAGRLGGVAVRR